MTRQRRPRRTVSAERKNLHGLGLTLQVIGGVGIIICFIGFATAGMSATRSFGESGSPIGWFIGFFICMVLTAVGGGMRGVAQRGLAGSGLVLDPERARDDLEPWARTGGGLVSDALDEAGVNLGGGAPAPEPKVQVRCRKCRTLNDETDRFCSQCGAAL